MGGCTYQAAAKVCEADPDTLQSLLDKSLLRRREAMRLAKVCALEVGATARTAKSVRPMRSFIICR